MPGERNRVHDRPPRRIPISGVIVAPVIPGATARRKGISSSIRVAWMPGTPCLLQVAFKNLEAEQQTIDYPGACAVAGGDPFQEIFREHADAAGWNRIRNMDGMVDQNIHGRHRSLTRRCGMPY